MGLLLVQALGRCLLGDLIAIDNNADRLTLAGEMGATRMIDGRLEGGTDILQAVGPPADLCFDCTSGRNGLATATRLVRQGGTVVVFGWKREPLGDLGTDWHMKGLTVHNPTPFCRKRDVFPPAIRLIERGHVSPGRLVTHTEPMVRLDRLLEQASTRAGGYVKGVVLTEQ
jgi:threonine dehydrogenase-like Zn-dependent dehydrogenase